jgi:hypothetical protein
MLVVYLGKDDMLSKAGKTLEATSVNEVLENKGGDAIESMTTHLLVVVIVERSKDDVARESRCA